MPAATRQPEKRRALTVRELTDRIQGLLETEFLDVWVEGEISNLKFMPSSGHYYFSLKDADAQIKAVVWRSDARLLKFKPQDGMKVLARGQIKVYAPRGDYKLQVQVLEPMGKGSLQQAFEELKERLDKEGLFAPERKRPLPLLPRRIGVVTSPTGAVIRDILHRLADRFPRHVILWPVPVQGEGAAEKVAAAIAGFNALPEDGPIPRPDVLIVARGGGSLEDLWTFNEEVVVRAAAASDIPLISAIGHETDTTLIDYAADVRAPTPTAAAEMAVPVRADLQAQTMDIGRRLFSATTRLVGERRTELAGLARGLPEPQRLLEEATIRLDNEADRLRNALANVFQHRRAEVGRLAGTLRHPREIHALSAKHVEQVGLRFVQAMRATVARRQDRYQGRSVATRLPAAFDRLRREAAGRLGRASDLLKGLSYERTLERGFAIVQDPSGAPVTSIGAATPGSDVSIRFHDGAVGATVHGESVPPARPPLPRRKSKAGSDDPQGSLI